MQPQTQKSQLIQLMTKKDLYQKQLLTLTQQINKIDKIKQYQKGVTDVQGFPRKDLDYGDLAHYRILKKKKNQLNNDHLQLMKQIQKKLYQYHQKLPKVQGNQQIFTKQQQQNNIRKYMKTQQNPQKQQQNPQQQQQLLQQYKQKQQKQIKQQEQSYQQWKKQFQHGHYKIQYLPPFAKIIQVPLHSPAHKSGIFPNDLLSQFSQINIYTPDNIKHIPYHVRENQQVKIVLLRPLQEQKDISKIQQNKEKEKKKEKEKGRQVYKLKDDKWYEKVQVKVVPQRWEGRGLLGCRIDPL